jgi:hemerythrin
LRCKDPPANRRGNNKTKGPLATASAAAACLFFNSGRGLPMSLKYWESDMETGFVWMDVAHRKLAAYLEEIEQAIAFNDRGKTLHTLIDIIAHLEHSFPDEERFMQESGYPIYDDHVRVHRSFVRKLRSYQERHQKGEDLSRNVAYDLKIWLSNHIRLQDGNFAHFVRERRKGPIRGWLKKIFS